MPRAPAPARKLPNAVQIADFLSPPSSTLIPILVGMTMLTAAVVGVTVTVATGDGSEIDPPGVGAGLSDGLWPMCTDPAAG